MIDINEDHVSVRPHPVDRNQDFLDQFKQNAKVIHQNLTPSQYEFDLIGVHSSFANAVRRIMLSELPTMAIEQCCYRDNTGVIPDEILAHRLGLVPIRCPPALFDYVQDPYVAMNSEAKQPEISTDRNTLQFSLYYKAAPSDKKKKSTSFAPSEAVTSAYIRWVPHGDQVERVKAYYQDQNQKRGSPGIFDDFWNQDVESYAETIRDHPESARHAKDSADLELPNSDKHCIRPVITDIVLNKLAPNQCLQIDLFAQKGIGMDHAKFNPVSVATYRTLPTIELLSDIKGDDAQLLQECFPDGVIGIKKGKAYVKDARLDTVSREVFRHPQLKDKLKLGRRSDHFIFNVESTGQYSEPYDIVIDALLVLKQKSISLRQMVDQLRSSAMVVDQ